MMSLNRLSSQQRDDQMDLIQVLPSPVVLFAQNVRPELRSRGLLTVVGPQRVADDDYVSGFDVVHDRLGDLRVDRHHAPAEQPLTTPTDHHATQSL